MERKNGAVPSLSSRMGEYYCIDLDCLPKRVSQIIQFTTEIFPGWTAADTCIYCIGGFKENSIVGRTLHMYKYSNTTESTPTWTAMEPDRNLPLLHPFVFAFGRKIYVISGHEPVIYINHEDNTDLTYPGEYYHLETPKHRITYLNWRRCMVFVMIIHVMDDKTRILFYDGITFLFYNLVENAWKDGDRLQFFREEGLEEDHKLWDLVHFIKPVVCDSTLYWFHIDMCLYGFDYSRKRWFQSNSLQQKLRKPVPLCDCLYSATFVIRQLSNVCSHLYRPETGTETFELAIIKVKRNTHSGSIKVSLKSFQCIAVNTSHTMMSGSRCEHSCPLSSELVSSLEDASSEEKDVEKKGQWRLPTYFTAIGAIGAVALLLLLMDFTRRHTEMSSQKYTSTIAANLGWGLDRQVNGGSHIDCGKLSDM
ncbi:hypothetical protein FXO37_09268 [Capsicum annuum]|nr:hypothetical protein FXO37_09268 [Capsicum annuum]